MATLWSADSRLKTSTSDAVKRVSWLSNDNALPFSLDAQNSELPFVTGHVGIHMQTLRGGAVLCAAVSNVITVFYREENEDVAPLT